MKTTRVVAAITVVLATLATFGCTSPEKPHRDILATEEKLYSQANEELIIRDFFQDKEGGFFVDIGCAWPIRISTTYYLEKHLGWTGIAVDALAEYAEGWAEKRPNSTFLQYAVTDRSGGTIAFHRHAVPSVSSLSKEQAALWGGEEHLTEIKVTAITLNDLLDQQGVKKIDHLTIDIEGAEPGALTGFDIERFQPELVCIEGGRVNGDFYLEYFGEHGYERIEKYAEHDKINWYFRRVK
jgi:FkbM family methyltransferase